jgi:predicted Rossmann fold flavoprotein
VPVATPIHSLPQSYDAIILGAGAAGLMCAFEAGCRGLRVLVLDNGPKPGRKILISGGGRCNFTNLGTRAENFLSANPHFAKSALARFTPLDFLVLVQKHGIRYHEKTLGQLFCDDSAQRIVSLLLRECEEAKVELRMNAEAREVRALDSGNNARFAINTAQGELTCNSLVVATGGLSIPKLGVTGFGYELARQFGHTVIEPRAALVPLVFNPQDRDRWCDLTGLSTEAIASAPAASSNKPNRRSGAPAFREKLLITHRGLSGPAVLQISSYWQPGRELHFDLAPAVAAPFAAMRTTLARRDRNAVLTSLKAILPTRLAERWLTEQESNGLDLSDAGLARMEQALHSFAITPAGTEGFAKAEVTAGGIDTRELDSNTMMSRRVPGLHFIGEVVDVTGWLGGYNFQWAWASAAAAGRSL